MTDLPDWLPPIVERINESTTADFTRFAPPESGGRRSAVLILLGTSPTTGDFAPAADVLLLERAATLRNHAGQPAFPGGAADEGEDDPAVTALREAEEEVGLDPASVQVLTTLPDLWIPVSDYIVTPVLAWWHSPHPVGPVDAGEVARVVRVPIADLVDPANRIRVRHSSGYVSPAFEVADMQVWGFTAGVLSVLLDIAQWSVPWDQDRIAELR
ncbi:coenzyme A pyrophosphatase [Longispora fulva]|uniref:8-oxo-dGTP pyrophosphatase MutT (NUDIX family) n=1 Tax=Longispora fulva TaxID=619741 RepID=A0A8J7GTQ3_9ACTN|nr:CoA pyrophosphatase [Longispora fulva]MBG6139355.1 8-oxo-dGTP pyrophosphatase MutT (NUDIX family) [Longispora fulva]GIG58852.1 coenzyme A pyrophosphatase [Longispora fulva]